MPPSSVIVSPVLKESAAQMPQVAAVPIKTPENALSFSLIHAKKKFLTPSAQRFCKYVRAQTYLETAPDFMRE